MRILDFTSITEEQGKTAVFAFGRMNPPTIGHKKLADAVLAQAGDPYIFLSQSQKPQTDPLDFATKLKFAQKFFPGITVGNPEVKTVIQALTKLDQLGYDNIIYIAGSDRIADFTKLLNQYNGQPDKKGNIAYKFNDIQVVSAGERDPDAEGAEGMSASKMRAAAAAGEFEAFASGTPDPKLAKPMYDAVRSGMGITETTHTQRMLKVIETLQDLHRAKPLDEATSQYVLKQLTTIREHLNNINEATLDLPDLETGDELMVGKFKNRKATIKDFKKDEHGQPVAVTNKGDQKIFKGRVKKLMPTEGKSPHKKGTEKYRKHMAAMHAGMNEAKKSGSYLLQLERDNDLLVLHIKNTKTGQRTEVRGKPGYELDGYDATDPLHQMLDKVGKAANISDLMNGDVVSINPNHPDGPRAREELNQITDEGISYTNPQFDVEWEEANRYPYLEKLGTEGWEELAKTGRAVRVTKDSVKNIGNTGADGSESLDDLEPEKVARLKQAMDSGTVEMPIVVKQPDGSLELIAGNTRLIGLISTQGEAQVWLVDASTLTEGVGRIVKGVNTTPDVGVNQTKIEAAKLGSKVDKDGRPPLLHKKAAKNSDTNTLFNLGLAEGKLSENNKSHAVVIKFVNHCKDKLELPNIPTITLVDRIGGKTFGQYDTVKKDIAVQLADRHIVDVLRTLAHELVHHKQRHLHSKLDGSDGSDHENQANALAGKLMRQFGKRYPKLYEGLQERASIGVPLSSGLTVNIAPHRKLKIKKSTMGRHNYENPRTKKSRKS